MNVSRSSKNVVAIADVGSGSIGFALVVMQKGQAPRFIACERAILPIEERTDEQTIAALSQLLSSTIGKVFASSAKSGARAAVDEVYCIVRAPWTHSRTARLVQAFNGPTIATSELINDLAVQALGKITDLRKADVLEASVIRVELNGYPTAQPEGKSATEITVAVLMSDCVPSVRSAIENALGTHLPHIKPVYRSGIRALISSLRDTSARADYFIIEMSSQGSALTAVRDGSIAEQTTIAEGIHTILKRIHVDGLPEETLTLLRLLARDQCETEACEKLRKSLALAEPELAHAFGDSIGKLASVRRLPNQLVLMTYPELLPWLSQFFARIDFAQFTLTSQPFVVTALTAENMQESITSEIAVDDRLLAAAALVHSEHSVK